MTVAVLNYLLPPLLLTIAVEGIVGGLLIPERRFLHTVFIMNLITNPLMNLIRIVIYQWMHWNYGVIPILELAVWQYEAAFIKVRHPWSHKKARILSLILNASSFAFSYILT